MAEFFGLHFPDDYYFHEEHAWARVEEDGTVTVGMDEFFAKEAGEVVYVDFPFEGDEVAFGETCGKLQTAKWIGKLVSPISGEVVAMNEEVQDYATIMNESPYQEGWLIKVRPSNLDGELPRLMKGTVQLEAWAAREKARSEAEQAKAAERQKGG